VLNFDIRFETDGWKALAIEEQSSEWRLMGVEYSRSGIRLIRVKVFDVYISYPSQIDADKKQIFADNF
jgi:hypothetical protein